MVCFVGWSEWQTDSSQVIIQKCEIVKATPDLEPRQWETISTKQGTWKQCMVVQKLIKKIKCRT